MPNIKEQKMAAKNYTSTGKKISTALETTVATAGLLNSVKKTTKVGFLEPVAKNYISRGYKVFNKDVEYELTVQQSFIYCKALCDIWLNRTTEEVDQRFLAKLFNVRIDKFIPYLRKKSDEVDGLIENDFGFTFTGDVIELMPSLIDPFPNGEFDNRWFQMVNLLTRTTPTPRNLELTKLNIVMPQVELVKQSYIVDMKLNESCNIYQKVQGVTPNLTDLDEQLTTIFIDVERPQSNEANSLQSLVKLHFIEAIRDSMKERYLNNGNIKLELTNFNRIINLLNLFPKSLINKLKDVTLKVGTTPYVEEMELDLPELIETADRPMTW
jgi:hypothetical protein